MRCSVCGTELGGRGGRCPNNGEKWHNKKHKERFQRRKNWGGPLEHWEWPWSQAILPLMMARTFDDMKDPGGEWFERHKYHDVTHEISAGGHLVKCEDCRESALA